MNVNNNKRRESQDKIIKVFIELLQEKNLEKISVSDICKRANLNRSTFYANYIDIYDLAEKVCEQLEEDFRNLYKEEMQSKMHSYDFVRLFAHIKENQLFYKTYFKLGFKKQAVIGYDEHLAEKFFQNKHIDYHIEFFEAGFNAIVKKWLVSGCKETPEEMCEIIVSEMKKTF